MTGEARPMTTLRPARPARAPISPRPARPAGPMEPGHLCRDKDFAQPIGHVSRPAIAYSLRKGWLD